MIKPNTNTQTLSKQHTVTVECLKNAFPKFEKDLKSLEAESTEGSIHKGQEAVSSLQSFTESWGREARLGREVFFSSNL